MTPLTKYWVDSDGELYIYPSGYITIPPTTVVYLAADVEARDAAIREGLATIIRITSPDDLGTLQEAQRLLDRLKGTP